MNNIEYIIYTDGFNDLETLLFEEIQNEPNVKIISKNATFKNKILQKLFRLHMSFSINNIIKLPFKNIWYKSLDRPCVDENTKRIYIFMASWYYPGFYQYLRKKHTKAKLVLYFGDTIISKQRAIKGLCIEKIKTEVDAIYSYNPKDVRDYGVKYLPMCYSKSSWADCDANYSKPLIDLLFIGAARKRYDKILKLYDYSKAAGLNVFFYIVDTRQNPISREDFIVSDRPISMKDYLRYVGKSKSILEILDSESEGSTLRFWDAIMYNKYLITNNKHVLDSKFFDIRYIKYFSDISKLDLDFLREDTVPVFNYNGENSPRNFIDKITADLF